MKRSLPITALGVAAAGLALARSRRASRRIDFNGRAVAIVGASRGLGLALAREFVAEGARVALLARESEALRRATDELRARGTAVAIPCDLHERGAAARAIDEAAAALGRLDVLVYNAGTIIVGPLEHMGEEEYAATLDIHFWGPLRAMRAAIPRMRRQGGGRIVNIASIGGLVAIPHLAPYSASKFALVGLSDAFRAELARDNILVTTVSPGLMRTGSPPNAKFKGQHKEEYRWFAASDAFPLLSIAADRAARQIVEACRHGDPSLTISWQAKAAALANAIAPGMVAGVSRLATRLLPGPDETGGERTLTGWESQTELFVPWLTDLADEQATSFNQRPPNAATAQRGGSTMPEQERSQIPLTPSQAEGERDTDQAASERGADTPERNDPNRKPSQAEGERSVVEDDLRQQEANPGA
jgi:NAD(P)-dependent dehydrogenase (short-subunit alcohol dehydrogenase family)